MTNDQVARVFRDIASLLQVKGDNPFRVRAYERAAQTIGGMNEDLSRFVREGALTAIPGIGADLASKITELYERGTLKAYEELKKEVPEGLLSVMSIPSVGPKTARLLFDTLHIQGIDDLVEALDKNKLVGLPGIKAKTVENIRKGLAVVSHAKERMPLYQAVQLSDELTAMLSRLPSVRNVIAAGSLRRRKETVRDIDILVCARTSDAGAIMDAFVGAAQAQDVLAKGETKASVRTQQGVQVDCRVVEEKSFGAALLYFTGSRSFNIHLRSYAQAKGFMISEYGLFRITDTSRKGDESVRRYRAGKTEEEIFDALHMDYIQPEMREDTGEIEQALAHVLPRLLEVPDVRGDLHTHSSWSDGQNTVAEMADEAARMGYAYIALTDHSQSLKIAHGLSGAELRRKKREIEAYNAKNKKIRVLFGTEVDIAADGSLDYPDRQLREFDIVIAAVHSGFSQSAEKMTSRLVRAASNKNVHIIAHPTGRLWGVRDSYPMDFDKVLAACKEYNTALELSSFGQRLDLNDQHCRKAKDAGVKVAINTDAHILKHLHAVSLGVGVARRGWLTRDDVLNTMPLDSLLQHLRK